MSFVVKKRDLTDPAQLRALIVEHADDLERGLTILDSRLLGQTAIDVVALDADGALVLIAVGLVADEEMFMKAVDAYSWCLEYPDAIRRLYPAVRFSTEQPPRVMFVVERMPDAFHRKIKQLGFHEVDCVEFRHLDVDGTAAVYFDILARLRRGAVPTAPASDLGPAPAAPGPNGRPTSLKLQKLLGADRPPAPREPAPVVRIVHRAASRPEPAPLPIAPRAERAVAPKQSVDATRRSVDAPAATSPFTVVTPPAPPVSEPVGAAVAAPASLDVVASLEDAGVPEILAQDLDTAEGLLEPFATLEPTRNGHVEPSPITIREPEPVIRDLELAIREPEPAVPELALARDELEPADVLEAVPDVVAAELSAPAEAEPLTLDEAAAPEPEPVQAVAIAGAPEPEPVQAVVTTIAPERELVIPVLELEPRAIVEATPASEVSVIGDADPVVLPEPEPAGAALRLESAEPVVPVAAPAAPTSVFSRRPAEAVAARDAKVSFAGMAKDLLPRNHRAPQTEPPVSAPRASVEEITRGALDELVGATDKRTSEEQPAASAKASGPFAKAPSLKRPRTIAPPPSEGQPIAGGPKLGNSPKRVGAPEAAAPAAEGEAAQPMPEGFEGLQFPNDGVLTRQWMEFLNQMAAGK